MDRHEAAEGLLMSEKTWNGDQTVQNFGAALVRKIADWRTGLRINMDGSTPDREH